jgi:predicted Zn-ribbon and HTH transcriptional regulator
MTKSLEKIIEILQEKGENLSKEDIAQIRELYVDLSLKENTIINDIEEIISQIEITPKEDVKI